MQMRNNHTQNNKGMLSNNHPGTLFSSTAKFGDKIVIEKKDPLILNHQVDLFKNLDAETQSHIKYLSSIGLGERAKGIKFDWFKREDLIGKSIELSSFTRRNSIPKIVENFNPYLKNTIITTDLDADENKSDDLNRILDIRVYPALRKMIRSHSMDIFLGSKAEMLGYYENSGATLLFQFTIPSSATYYLIETESQQFKIVMAGLVGRDNMIAQLLTLKLAEIDLQNIEIIGDFTHYRDLINQDIVELSSRISDLSSGEKHPLIVAGCGLEQMVCDILLEEYKNQLGTPTRFEGNIISLIYLPIIGTDENRGIISLNLNYGEITEHIVSSFLLQFNCKHVFSGSAGGYLPLDSDRFRPEIGSRISIEKCMNEELQVSDLGPAAMFPYANSETHLQVPSIFLETYEWLEQAKQRGRSVDIETFYIVRAIQEFNRKNPNQLVMADCGYFVSDYVGEKPLREYSKVFVNYAETLKRFINEALDINLRNSISCTLK